MTVRQRIRNACRTNDPQMSSVTIFTLLNIAMAAKEHSSWPVMLFAALFWPCVAFTANLISPIPEPKP